MGEVTPASDLGSENPSRFQVKDRERIAPHEVVGILSTRNRTEEIARVIPGGAARWKPPNDVRMHFTSRVYRTPRRCAELEIGERVLKWAECLGDHGAGMLMASGDGVHAAREKGHLNGKTALKVVRPVRAGLVSQRPETLVTPAPNASVYPQRANVPRGANE